VEPLLRRAEQLQRSGEGQRLSRLRMNCVTDLRWLGSVLDVEFVSYKTA
jgi:hypothetical protein